MPKIYFFKRSICLMLILSVMICLVSCSKETNTDNQIDTNTDTNIATEIEYDHIGSKSSSGSINLSDKGAEGSATLTVTCIYYEGRDGNQHLKLDEISYEILNSPVFEKVEITYNDGKKTHQLENDKFSDKCHSWRTAEISSSGQTGAAISLGSTVLIASATMSRPFSQTAVRLVF